LKGKLVRFLKSIRNNTWPGLVTVLSDRRYGFSAAFLSFVFFGLYLFSIQHIVYLSGVDFSYQAAIPSVKLVSNWMEKVFRVRASFVWEPVAAIYLTPHLLIKLAVPNLLIGSGLAGLVGANLSVGFYELFRGRSSGSVESVRGVFAAIPGLLTGFACCAPTVLIAISGSLAAGIGAGLVAARPYFIPASLALLLFNLTWTAANVGYEGVCRGELADVEDE
jgi:hypothetical protein